MRFLLDTQVLLWALAEPRRLPAPVRRLMESGDAEFHFSLGSIWEIAIKRSLGKLDFEPDLIADTAEADGHLPLPILREHLSLVARLPWHHRDPFDRLLVAQSLAEPMALLTADAALARYGPTVRGI
ncbi:MAG: type II toxin-antitoxin system VapC family toxin [Lautropia sp.]|nr:type II toxin-antitoxin system VapC family toxin [Lautropia sp.]MCL4701168.1 type II toxin-antitoxin system VapC family toxin [Burkholderiaceae bacterium]MDL1908993.1 type II toxin-antitoxin system VapC family toxin [Betaproteobacteria bacterium PRO1]